MALFDVILAATLNDLAELYKEEGRYADAEPLYKRALATWKKALRPDHPDVVQSLNNLADLYSAEGSPRRCRATLQAGAGVNTRAEGEYPQFLDAFCLGLKEFGYVENLSRL